MTRSENFEDDKLFGVAGALLGAWGSVKQKDALLQQIFDAAEYRGLFF